MGRQVDEAKKRLKKVWKIDDETVKVKMTTGMFTVRHVDDYGVLVTGTVSKHMAALVLFAVGYKPKQVRQWGWMPTMVDQTTGAWPHGHSWGGRPAVGFYFPGVMPNG